MGRTEPEDRSGYRTYDDGGFCDRDALRAARRCVCLLGSVESVVASAHRLVRTRHGGILLGYSADGEPAAGFQFCFFLPEVWGGGGGAMRVARQRWASRSMTSNWCSRSAARLMM